MEQEPTVETQKTAYDAVDGKEPIRELEIKALITHYGKLLGKERIVRVAGNLANQLITVVGVETYNDLRGVTFEIYADRCGVILIDAALLVRQFGIPVVPRLIQLQWRQSDHSRRHRCRHLRRVRRRAKLQVMVRYVMSNYQERGLQHMMTLSRPHSEMRSGNSLMLQNFAVVLRSRWDRVQQWPRLVEISRMTLQLVRDRNPLTSLRGQLPVSRNRCRSRWHSQ